MSNVVRLQAEMVKLTNVFIALIFATFLAVPFTYAKNVMLENGEILLQAALDLLEELIPVSSFILAIVMVWVGCAARRSEQELLRLSKTLDCGQLE